MSPAVWRLLFVQYLRALSVTVKLRRTLSQILSTDTMTSAKRLGDWWNMYN